MNPFEQFRIMILKLLNIGSYDVSVTNNAIILLTITALLITIQIVVSLYNEYKPNNWLYFIESIYTFVFTIVKEQSGRKGYKYFPHLYTIFGLILLYNLCGLIPFSFTVSSQVIITFTLAMSYFIAWTIIGIILLRTHFLYVFCPKNMPLWLIPLLICVELLSYCLRPISLGVRLFANMLAGHILLHILGNAFTFLYSIALILIIPAFLILSAIGVLELGISGLQAYIFTILLAIYLKDSLVSHGVSLENIHGIGLPVTYSRAQLEEYLRILRSFNEYKSEILSESYIYSPKLLYSFNLILKEYNSLPHRVKQDYWLLCAYSSYEILWVSADITFYYLLPCMSWGTGDL